MNLPHSPRSGSALLLSLIAAAGLSATSLFAQSVATTPVGAVNVTIAASANGTSYNVSQIAVPLLGTPLVPGASGVESPTGRLRAPIASLTANTITVDTAGWTASQLAQTGFPMFVRVLSGANAGRCLQVTANTATVLTVDNQGTDLTTAGYVTGANGDQFEIVAGDTILGLFGTTADGIIGGTATDFSQNKTDRVTINVGSSIFNYYFNTDVGQWRRSGSTANQGNIVIPPQGGVVYSRISTTPLTITALGNVPVGVSRLQLTRPLVSIVGRQFPTDTTLSALGIHNVANWRKANAGGVTIATSDKVLIKTGASLLSFYYDATLLQWRRSGSTANQDGVVVSADSAVRIQRAGTAGSDTWTLSPNYTL
jgi:uncharacterized protein (TIGR02597 family)